MALNTRISNAAAKAAADAVTALVDVGTGQATGYIEIRSGTQPADPDTAATGTMLVKINTQNPAYGAASDGNPGGVCALNGTPSAAATNAGTAGWFRQYDRDGNAIFDGECGTSGADMNLDNLSIGVGQTVTITSGSYKHPET